MFAVLFSLSLTVCSAAGLPWQSNLQAVSSRKQHFKHERYRLTLQPVSRFVIFTSRANSETPLPVSLVHPIEKQSKRRPRTVIKHQTWVGHEMNFPSRLKTMNEKQIHTTAVLYGTSIFFGVANVCFLMVKQMKEHLSVAPQNKLCGPQRTTNWTVPTSARQKKTINQNKAKNALSQVVFLQPLLYIIRNDSRCTFGSTYSSSCPFANIHAARLAIEIETGLPRIVIHAPNTFAVSSIHELVLEGFLRIDFAVVSMKATAVQCIRARTQLMARRFLFCPGTAARSFMSWCKNRTFKQRNVGWCLWG